MYRIMIAFLLCANVAFAQGVDNIGFAPYNIWFSANPFFANETITIYTFVFNSSPYQTDGNIVFYDGDIVIGEKVFSVPGNGNAEQIGVEWYVTKGAHNIHANIIAVTQTMSDGSKEAIFPEHIKTEQVALDADTDSDGDRVGDREDEDDDNDGISDYDEILLRTNPLDADTDGDGVHDGEDTNPIVFDKMEEASDSTQNNTSVAILEKAEYIKDKTPQAVKDVVEKLLEPAEKFRKELAKDASDRKDFAQNIIKQENEEIINAQSTRKPLAYISLAAASILGHIMGSKYIFYAIVVLLLCYIISRVYGYMAKS